MSDEQVRAIANNLVYCCADDESEETAPMTFDEFADAVRARMRGRSIVRWSAERGRAWRAPVDGMPVREHADWRVYWDDGDGHVFWSDSPEETLRKLDAALAGQ
jgi:hypothetical protein